jgi:hypothetical protein
MSRSAQPVQNASTDLRLKPCHAFESEASSSMVSMLLAQLSGRYSKGVQLTIMILIGTGELHFKKAKYLILRYRIRRRNGSHIFFDRHGKSSIGVTA